MNYTLKSYSNITSGESLIESFNATGFLVQTDFRRAAKGDSMLTEYSTKGGVLSDFYDFKPTKESLKIDYNKPEKGYRVYTVRYYANGDTLIITVNPYGKVVSREYKKTPGEVEYPNPLRNCAYAHGKVGNVQIDSIGDPGNGNLACDMVEWTCQSPQLPASIKIYKVADREVAVAGDLVKYTYTVENTGSVTISPLTIIDDKLGLIILNEKVDLQPGAVSDPYYGYYTVKAGDVPRLVNTVVAEGLTPDGDKVTSKAKKEVKIVPSCLTKTASPKVVKPGDYVTYNITWYVSGDKIVDDYPNGVSFVSASPEPINEEKNTWNIDPKKDSGTIIILVQVAQDIGNTSFDMGQGVTGTGFVNVHNDIRTNPVILSNKATLFRENSPVCTAFADVNIGPPQTYAALKEHGSGNYASEDVIKYQNSNRSIEWNKSLTATYKPTTFYPAQ